MIIKKQFFKDKIDNSKIEIPQIPERLMRNCRFFYNRYKFLPLLPKNAIVAEVGVLAGDFSRHILDVCQPKELHLIDIFNCDDYKQKNRFNAEGNFTFVNGLFQREIEKGEVNLHRGLSWEMMAKFPDNHFDWIYIDAAHDYASVKKDIEIAGQKLKEDGYLIMNDYIISDHHAGTMYGVVQATNEFMIENNYEMLYYAFHPELFCDVVIRKVQL